MMLFLALIIIFSAKTVEAQDQYKLSLEKVSGVYFSRRGKNFNDDSYPYYLYKFGDIFAYCIEPGKHITTYTYVGEEEFVDLGFSEELKEKLELIGYYGRDYPGHDNIRYSMATQALIWELTGVDTVTFWTGQNETGSEIDITNERNEIMRLVDNHKTLPDFKTHYYGNLKHEIRIKDSNNVLNSYEVTNDGLQDVYIDNNSLVIMPRTVGIYSVELSKRNYNEFKTIIFVGKGDNSTQKIARLHFTKEIKTDFTIVIDGISLLVHKVDENNNPIKIENIKFKVRDLTRGKDICSGLPNCIHTTGKDGFFITEPLDYGEYEIEEIEDQIIQGYSWNKNKLHIVINEETEFNYNEEYYDYIDLYFNNKSVTGSLEINKTGEKEEFINNSVSYQEQSLGNIEFNLYTSDDKLIKSIVTDNNGYAKVDNLPLGKYYLLEKTKLDNYIEQGKIPFEIKQDNQYDTSFMTTLNIKNILKKGKLELSKIDLETKEGISGTIIEIYDSNNKLLFTKETDANGKIIIDNLPYGKYYIKEKQANYYYEITDEIIPFEIKNNGEIIKKNLTNKRIVGDIEINKLAENYHFIDNDIIYKKECLHGIEFSIYDNNNNFIANIKTNDDGYAKYTNLPLGKYYVKENTHLDKYVFDDNKYYFEIKKDGNKAINVQMKIVNYIKKGELEFTKEDLVTSDGIPNTIIEIYDDNNYLLFTKKTDEFGKVIINNLPVGKYYIVEKEANSLYLLTNEKIFFEIKENGEIVKAKMTNERKEIPVPKTNTKENIVAHSIFGISFLIGIGRMYYEKKWSY